MLPEVSQLRKDRRFLRRYLNIEYGISAILNSKLSLINPIKWDDKNDVFLMDTFRSIHRKRHVHAACFTTAPERNHHWTSFSSNDSSMCLVFNNKRFVRELKSKNSEVIHGHVIYMSAKSLRNLPTLLTEKIPFIKGIGYLAEEEYRLVSPPTDSEEQVIKIDFSLSCLDHVLLAPNTPPYIERAVRRELEGTKSGVEITVKRSVLPDDEDWKCAAMQLTF